ncbi:SDR family NAD(P)-dependent oxidoreductase [Vannielia litorea]|uniref:NAD(P)-dependent dehydrogenase, short-chain alcohol dehydrogenase family n=1 Tax=Vannielia litorea TaxID=1217970 RepID=A0A1N6FWN2_9RHOB|nr:glucose 1-dehydrogenase [Vannielia litorea]SIN99653.1 NAD(P)-dependent dehydrogenase, short-chain alcohol dehydrogenase family [Vannielia litorea]
MPERPSPRRVVLITGAASGFGAGAARGFAAQGARLVLCDIDEKGLETLAESLRAAGAEVLARRVDVTEEAAQAGLVAAALRHFGQLDVAINNAGLGQPFTPLARTEARDFDRIMAVNARGVFLGMKHQVPPMQQARAGVILNIASVAGLTGAGHLAAYAAAKHAVVGLTRAAADELARHNIRVNALCPAFAETPLFAEMADRMASRTGEDAAQTRQRITARVPMGRVATVDEVVQAMLWTCAPANTFMTGQALAIDGGLTAI